MCWLPKSVYCVAERMRSKSEENETKEENRKKIHCNCNHRMYWHDMAQHGTVMAWMIPWSTNTPQPQNNDTNKCKMLLEFGSQNHSPLECVHFFRGKEIWRHTRTKGKSHVIQKVEWTHRMVLFCTAQSTFHCSLPLPSSKLSEMLLLRTQIVQQRSVSLLPSHRSHYIAAAFHRLFMLFESRIWIA